MHQPQNDHFFWWTLLAVSLCKIIDTICYPLHPAPSLLKEHYWFENWGQSPRILCIIRISIFGDFSAGKECALYTGKYGMCDLVSYNVELCCIYPCISRPPILEPKNKFFLFLCKNFLEKLLFYLRISFQIRYGFMKKTTASLDVKLTISLTWAFMRVLATRV